MKKSITLIIATMLCSAMSVCWDGGENARAEELSNDDCSKCHAAVVNQVTEAGAMHKTEVTCLDCHSSEHPPGVEQGSMIPQCTNCHEGDPHFQLENCLECHRNPHQPLNITFGDNVKPACNTCHQQVVETVDTFPSAHAEVDCSFCHEKHLYIPNCLDCHSPHMEGQQFEECVKCHQVHKPLQLNYGTDVANSSCGACHADIRTTLEAGSTKHTDFQCVFCHANQHGNIPDCQECHGSPHNEQMLSKFTGCNDCHQSAHDLLK